MSEQKLYDGPTLVAWRLTEEGDNDALAQWCGADDWGYEWERLYLQLATGHRAHEGDWICVTDSPDVFVGVDHGLMRWANPGWFQDGEESDL